MHSEMEIFKYNGLDFRVRRRSFKRRFSVTMRINGQHSISVNKGATFVEIHGFLEAQKKWIEKQSLKIQKLKLKYPKLIMESGTKVMLLGNLVELELYPRPSKKISVFLRDKKIRIEHPYDFEIQSQLDQSKIAQALREFYKNSAKIFLDERVKYWVTQTSLKPTSLRYRGQKSVWGTCSSKGVVYLNWKLMAAPPQVIDYVIVHELCHLKYLNHSKSFWSLVKSILPNYELQKKWLKEHVFDFEFLQSSSDIHPI